MARTNQRHTPELKKYLVAQVEAGANLGALARQLGVKYQTAYNWVNRDVEKITQPAKKPRVRVVAMSNKASESLLTEDEVKALRAEVAALRDEIKAIKEVGQLFAAI